MALGTLTRIVFVRPIACMASHTIGPRGVMVESGVSPTGSIVTLRTLPIIMPVWFIIGMARLAVVANIVVVEFRIFPV